MLVKSIGVIGNGVVGSAMVRCFLEHAGIVRVYDRDDAKSTHTFEETADSNWIFVAVPTPMNEKGGCDVSAVDDVLKRFESRDSRIILRSTVPPGTSDYFAERYDLDGLVHSPEFLTARCSFIDAQTPTRNLVGFTRGSGQVAQDLCDLYEARFHGTPSYRLPARVTEMAKLALNSLFATKVAFFNELYRACEALAEEPTWFLHGQLPPEKFFESVRGCVLGDGRIAHAHTAVPGPSGDFGFGGECLPKDISSLQAVMESLGVDAPLIAGVIASNVHARASNDDPEPQRAAHSWAAHS